MFDTLKLPFYTIQILKCISLQKDIAKLTKIFDTNKTKPQGQKATPLPGTLKHNPYLHFSKTTHEYLGEKLSPIMNTMQH